MNETIVTGTGSPGTRPNAKRAATKGNEVTRFDLSGGGSVHIAESHDVPLVSITVSLRSGSAKDPIGKDGSTKLALRMLRRGTKTHTAKDIEDELDRLGAELSSEVSVTSSSVHAQVIERNLDAFVDLLATLLSEPSFPQDELDRLKRETVAELIEARDSDRNLVQLAFRNAVFKGHAYGRGSTGSKRTLEAISVDDVRAAYGVHFVQGNVALGFSGDVATKRARELAERLVSRLPKGTRVPDTIVEPKAIPGRRLVFVDKPERTQTQIMIGGLGTAPHDDDHVALSVANAVFGGSFTSRLMREVRSKRGWSYGASARLPVDRQRQAFSMWTFPAATDAPACIALELDLLEAFVGKGVLPSELSFIKKFLGRSYAFDIDTASKRLHQELDVEVLGLRKDFYSAYPRELEAVTLEEANASVKARISLDDLLVVVVGTASELEEKVRASIPRLAETEVVPFDREE